jgi:hypothetical protein
MNVKKKILPRRGRNIFLFLAIVFAAAFFLFSSFKDYLKKNFAWKLEASVNEPLEKFSAACLKQFPAGTESQKIVNMRHCIYVNTSFSVDKKMAPMWQDRPAMMRWLYEHMSQPEKLPPLMECFYRAHTLSRSLKLLGYKAHTLTVTQDRDGFPDHVNVEVFNPDTKKWEVQDPSFDIHYVSKKDKSVLGPKEYLTLGYDDILPCNFEGQCDWDLKTSEGFSIRLTQDYMGAAYIKYENTLYLGRGYNENKKHDVQGKKISLCEFHPDYCKNIVRYGSLQNGTK